MRGFLWHAKESSCVQHLVRQISGAPLRNNFVNWIRSAMIIAIVCTGCKSYGRFYEIEDETIPGASPGGNNLPITVDRAYVFVSSLTTRGDLSGLAHPSCMTGSVVDRADCSCTEMARSANRLRTPTSKFIAWISTTTSESRCRIQGFTGLNCGAVTPETWYNTQGELVATGVGPLLTSSLTTPVKFDENGVTKAGNIFTGTLSNGVVSTSHCLDWTSSSNLQTGQVGLPTQTNNQWTHVMTRTCDQLLPIYCFALP
jgi:hypothetical protein